MESKTRPIDDVRKGIADILSRTAHASKSALDYFTSSSTDNTTYDLNTPVKNTLISPDLVTPMPNLQSSRSKSEESEKDSVYRKLTFGGKRKKRTRRRKTSKKQHKKTQHKNKQRITNRRKKSRRQSRKNRNN